MDVKKRAVIFLRPVLAFIIALLFGAIVIAAGGNNPIEAYRFMFLGSLGTKANLAETLLKTSSLYFASLSYAFANKCGLLNIGIEGQLCAGAICSAIVGIYVTGLPTLIHVTLCLIAGFLGGAILGMIVILLKNYFGASEVITTVMFNYLMLLLVDYLVSGPMRAEPAYPQTKLIQDSAKLPIIVPGTRINVGFILVLAALIFFSIFWKQGKTGFEMKMVGINPTASRAIGINVKRTMFWAMSIAGGLGGIVGALEVLGILQRVLMKFSAGYGFDGIAVALLASGNPIGILFASFLFGALKSGGNAMQMFSGVPSAVTLVITALVVIAMTVRLTEFSARKKV